MRDRRGVSDKRGERVIREGVSDRRGERVIGEVREEEQQRNDDGKTGPV